MNVHLLETVAQVGLGFDVGAVLDGLAFFFIAMLSWLLAALAGLFWTFDMFLLRRRYSIRELFKLTTYWSVLIAWGVFLFR